MVIAVDFDGTCVTHEFPEVSDRLYVDWEKVLNWLVISGML